MDQDKIIKQFGEIERRVEHLIESRKHLEDENAALKNENQRLMQMLQDKESADRQHDALKDLVRTKIESLMGRLDELSEEQI